MTYDIAGVRPSVTRYASKHVPISLFSLAAADSQKPFLPNPLNCLYARKRNVLEHKTSVFIANTIIPDETLRFKREKLFVKIIDVCARIIELALIRKYEWHIKHQTETVQPTPVGLTEFDVALKEMRGKQKERPATT